MRESLSPNNFVLLNGEPLEFSSEIDFLSWSKEFIENLSFLKISKNEVGHISHKSRPDNFDSKNKFIDLRFIIDSGGPVFASKMSKIVKKGICEKGSLTDFC